MSVLVVLCIVTLGVGGGGLAIVKFCECAWILLIGIKKRAIAYTGG